MICIVFSTVVYCVGLRPAITSWTTRTVDGPRLHSTVRISSSASVGRDGSFAIYENITTTIFVCQAVPIKYPVMLIQSLRLLLGASGAVLLARAILGPFHLIATVYSPLTAASVFGLAWMAAIALRSGAGLPV